MRTQSPSKPRRVKRIARAIPWSARLRVGIVRIRDTAQSGKGDAVSRITLGGDDRESGGRRALTAGARCGRTPFDPAITRDAWANLARAGRVPASFDVACQRPARRNSLDAPRAKNAVVPEPGGSR